MENRFYLMRKNEIITLTQFNEKGEMSAYSKNFPDYAKDIIPLAYRANPDKGLSEWWKERSIPLTRDQIKSFLESKGLTNPEQYLIKNLGLSLTDYYWIKPVDSDLTWESVNLFENDFHDNILLSSKEPKPDGIVEYSPNGSLQGNIEKTWTIIDNKRCLVKGNHTNTSNESFNEVIATEIYKKQNYNNYTNYNLIHIKDKPYKYGCVCEAFTSQQLELVSAWDIITSEEKNNSTSLYTHLINVCEKHGIDVNQLQQDLDLQIQVDYVLTGYDRHLKNISILRDADTLEFIRMAPIYDSGECLFANKPLAENIKELQKLEINSFVKSETKLLSLVQNRSLLDINKLPSPDFLREIYHKDEKISDQYINKLVEWYERKIDSLDAWQHGVDAYSALNKIQINHKDNLISRKKQTKQEKINQSLAEDETMQNITINSQNKPPAEDTPKK